MKNIKTITLTILLTAATAIIKAQPRSTVLDLQVKTEGVAEKSAPLDSVFEVTYVITLSDTVDVHKIHVRMGTTKQGKEVFSGSFVFDRETEVPEGSAYRREINKLFLTLTEYPLEQRYFHWVQLEDHNGQRSKPYIKQF